MKRITLTLLAVVLMASPIISQIIHVPADQPSIQAGIDSASDGDTVLVAEGTYLENINFRGKAITVASQFLLDRDTSHIPKTIIDGSEPVYPDSGSTVTMILARDTSSVLCGFTIQGGTGTGPQPGIFGWTSRNGGGIIMAGGKVINNRVKNNHVHNDEISSGGGITAGNIQMIDPDTGVNLVIRNNLVFKNSVHSDLTYCGGGGVLTDLNNGYTLVENNEIFENTTATESPYKAMSGGLHLGRSSTSNGISVIRNNFIHHNEAHSEFSFGGGLLYFLLLNEGWASNFQPTKIYNNVFANNHSDSHAGGACIWYDFISMASPPIDPVLMNNTFLHNYAEAGSGLGNFDAKVGLFNNIFWDDLPDEGGSEFFDGEFTYCPPDPKWWCHENQAQIQGINNNIRGGWPGESNISLDPYFESGSFHLSDSSACIGRGIDSMLIENTWYTVPFMDFSGRNRPDVIDYQVDIGALESEYKTVLLSVAELYLISYNNERISPDFHADSLYYELIVPDTTSSSMPLQAVPLDMHAIVDIDYPANLESKDETDRTATITVTSSDGSTQKDYSVIFQLFSTNAMLSDLTLTQGTLNPQFDPEITAYEATLPAGTTEAPTINCISSDEAATIKVNNAINVNSTNEYFRTSKIKVTSEYGEPFSTSYEILFNVETVGVGVYANDVRVKIYPNPTINLLTIETEKPNSYSIEIKSTNGQQIFTRKMEGTTHQLDLSSFQKGIYFISIRSKDFVTTKKIVKL